MKMFCLLFFLISILNQNLFAKSEETKLIEQLINKYNEMSLAEDRLFGSLVFSKFNGKQLSSRSYKMILVDQLGRKWLFKGGEASSMDGAVAVYKIYSLFGQETPEIHSVKLMINEEEVEGSLQKFVDGSENFKGEWGSLSDENRQYILNDHLLSYLTTNHHVFVGQYIVKNKSDNKLNIYRVDNSINWILLSSDSLSPSYRSPMLNHIPYAGFVEFWKQYLFASPQFISTSEKLFQTRIYETHFDLNFTQTINLANLASRLPDDFYKKFFDEIIKNNFKYASNNEFTSLGVMAPYEFLKSTPDKNFLEHIVKRKNNLFKDYKSFLKDLSLVTGVPESKMYSDVNMKSAIDKLIKLYQNKIDSMNADQAKIASLNINPVKITKITSGSPYSLYYILSKVGLNNNFFSSKETVISSLDVVMENIKQYRADYAKSNHYQDVKVSIDNTIDNLQTLKKYVEKSAFDRTFIKNILINLNLFFEKNYVQDEIVTKEKNEMKQKK